MASLMEELIATLRGEQETYQALLPVVESKTQAIVANDLTKIQQITEIEQEAIGKIMTLERKRAEVIKNMGIVLNKKVSDLTLPNLIRLLEQQPAQQQELKEIHTELTRFKIFVNSV